MDKIDHARAVNKQLQAELRAAEQAVQNKERIISAWVVKLLGDHADALADDLARVRAEYEQRRQMLQAFTYIHPAHSTGPVEISRKLHEALNALPAPLDRNYDSLRPMILEWSQVHLALTADADAIIEVA